MGFASSGINRRFLRIFATILQLSAVALLMVILPILLVYSTHQFAYASLYLSEFIVIFGGLLEVFTGVSVFSAGHGSPRKIGGRVYETRRMDGLIWIIVGIIALFATKVYASSH